MSIMWRAARSDRSPSQRNAGRGIARPHLSRRGLARALTGVVLLLMSCAPGADLPMLPPTAPGPYRLGAGDQVRVITFGGEQLTGEFRIDDSGAIAVPLLGSVKAAGLSSVQLGQRIAAELQSRNLIKSPSVSVEVVAYRPFFILGEVSKPGQYPYEPDMTVLTAVSIAGGFTYRAVTSYASIVRTEDGHTVEGRVARGSLVQPGDVITIFERHF